jgi:type III pantothenate kinase
MRLLAIDIGNTNIAAGIFENERLLKKIRIPTGKMTSCRNCLGRLTAGVDIGKTVISSVVPEVLVRLKRILRERTTANIFVIGEDIKAPIRNLYRVKNQVGQDRLVNAFAARTLYGAPAIVIDFGTAITFDIVSRKGEYAGGLILPGIELSLSSLYERTALLPKVKLMPSRRIIAKETKESMRGGILFGFGAMTDGLVARYKKILGPATTVIATGGNSPLMKRYTKSIRIVNEDLALKGLHLIAKRLG